MSAMPSPVPCAKVVSRQSRQAATARFDLDQAEDVFDLDTSSDRGAGAACALTNLHRLQPARAHLSRRAPGRAAPRHHRRHRDRLRHFREPPDEGRAPPGQGGLRRDDARQGRRHAARARAGADQHRRPWCAATEEDFALVECFQDGNRNCPIIPVCVLPAVLDRALQAFFRELDGQTLADLLQPKAKLVRIFRAGGRPHS